jgi:drug/metabolite transporter (DMT)-like permease
MTVSPQLRFKTYLLISMLIVLGPVGDLLLGRGMRRIGPAPGWSPEAILHHGFQMLTSPDVIVGTFLLIGFFISYTLVLTWADYSYVQPATALSYGIVAVLGRYALGEHVTPLRWVGIVVVCLGVLVIGYTPPRTTIPVTLQRPVRDVAEIEAEPAMETVHAR